jgi:hypothetical protein
MPTRLPVLVLQSATDSDALAAAEDIVLRNPLACSDLERLMDLSSLSDADDALAAFLQQCMSSAAADPVVLADVQIAFLAHFPARPEATAVEGALIANYAACDHLAELRSEPAIAGRAGFLPTITLTCAQTAEFFQDYSGAVERYQWFIDNAPTDDRLVAARDGLARSLIAEAQQGGAGSLPQPVDTGGSGSSLASVVIYNDSPEELRIVMSGPESRIEVLAASATSGEYDLVGPSSCRTDVPMLELQVPSGVYEVLVEATSGGISPFTGTWTLGRGDAYALLLLRRHDLWLTPAGAIASSAASARGGDQHRDGAGGLGLVVGVVGGTPRPERSHQAARSSPVTSRTSTSKGAGPSCTITLCGSATRLWYQTGLVGAPPIEATNAYSPPCSTRINAILRTDPVALPLIVTTMTGMPVSRRVLASVPPDAS